MILPPPRFTRTATFIHSPALFRSLDEAKIDESVRLSLFAQASSAMTSQMADLLRVTQTLTQAGPIVARLEPGVDRLMTGVDALLSPSVKRQWDIDRKSTRLNSSQSCAARMPSSACKKKKTDN